MGAVVGTLDKNETVRVQALVEATAAKRIGLTAVVGSNLRPHEELQFASVLLAETCSSPDRMSMYLVLSGHTSSGDSRSERMPVQLSSVQFSAEASRKAAQEALRAIVRWVAGNFTPRTTGHAERAFTGTPSGLEALTGTPEEGSTRRRHRSIISER